MSEDDILKSGISALQSGNRTHAASLFAQLVREHPASEQGWYLLGMSVSSKDQREYCFRRVLALNPKNSDAKKQLANLSEPAVPVSKPVQPSKPVSVVEPVNYEQNNMSPFVFEEAEEHSVKNKTEVPVSISSEKLPKNKKPDSQKKKSNRALFISLSATLFFGVCVIAVGYLFFPGVLTQLASPSKQTAVLLPTQTLAPLILTSTPTSIPPTIIPSPMPTVVYTPKFEEGACSFDTPRGVSVNCGYAIVPEDRTGDPSHTIRLAVAVFHSTSSNPKLDPVMFLQGGPGAEAVQLSADAYSVLVAPFLSERDYVTFDQRGTGLSEPALKCDELSRVYKQDIYGLIPVDTRKLVYSNAFLSCNGLLRAQGLNLNSYTTVESAADLKDILYLLGYQKVNLYGASYGTRLAQVVMRNYPEIVQTSILDSVVPVETNFFKNYPASIESGLQTLFDACTADLQCNTAYPDLKTVFWDLVNSLDANPVTVTTSAYPVGTVTETVDGSVLMSVILGSIKNTPFIDTAPQSIYRVKNGDLSTLISAQYSLPYAFEGINPGLYISMMCHEHILATNLEDLESISAHPGIENLAWLPFYGGAQDLFKECQSWGSVGPLLGENDPVQSDIPTLVITGNFDPTTPPIYARQVADHLTNSYYFDFPNQGHVPTASDVSGCAMDTVLEFLDNPLVEPGRDCLNKLEPVKFFTPYTGEPALDLKNVDLFGVSVDVPKGWFFSGDGFFVRGESAFDITQVGAFRAAISAQELKDYFSMSAYGYRGLDGVPVAAGTRNANGLTWELYIATSNGRPVDIALADSNGTSYVIMMFSHADEHDALYRTVFLPMVDSAQ